MLWEEKIIKKEITDLLLAWCDALADLQLDDPGRPVFDGGVLCPACGRIHGRCHEAAYPLLCAAELTGQEKYLRAAEKAFAWGENLLCDDGSMYNDPNSDWNGTTVFGAIAQHDALYYHGGLLAAAKKTAWEARLRKMGEWLSIHLTSERSAHLNYYAANACAMALLGRYFGEQKYLALAGELAGHCLSCVTENGLLCGEGGKADARTPKGCAAVDAGGYNAEETLPSLARYALTVGDAAALAKIKELYFTHLSWMLPDGAWDNSVGSRSFKWTWWGSRTTDGCTDALFRLGKDDPVFAEAAWRNFAQLKACTHGGLLYGGPDYHRRGEPPCVHHTFSHAKALAGALDGGLYCFPRVPLPSDRPAPLTEYPELATCRLAMGDWRADITANDLPVRKGARASGGVISLLWHKDCGPVVACSMAEEGMAEPLNQQLSITKEGLRSVCPRIEATLQGKRWAQYFDLGATMQAKETENAVAVHVDAFLCDEAHRHLEAAGGCTLQYKLTKDVFVIEGRVSPGLAAHARYVLPVIAEQAKVEVKKGSFAKDEPAEIFSLIPGFLCREYVIVPDRTGRFALRIGVNKMEADALY